MSIVYRWTLDFEKVCNRAIGTVLINGPINIGIKMKSDVVMKILGEANED